MREIVKGFVSRMAWPSRCSTLFLIAKRGPQGGMRLMRRAGRRYRRPFPERFRGRCRAERHQPASRTNPTSMHKYPAIHNAMWPGLVGKGGPGAEPPIDLETMLDNTAKAD